MTTEAFYLSEMRAELEQLKTAIIYVTKEKGDATKYLLDITKKHPNSIVYSVGGDGTLNEVVNGIYDTSCTIHIVPFGSGNDYYRSIKEQDILLLNDEIRDKLFIID